MKYCHNYEIKIKYEMLSHNYENKNDKLLDKKSKL